MRYGRLRFVVLRAHSCARETVCRDRLVQVLKDIHLLAKARQAASFWCDDTRLQSRVIMLRACVVTMRYDIHGFYPYCVATSYNKQRYLRNLGKGA